MIEIIGAAIISWLHNETIVGWYIAIVGVFTILHWSLLVLRWVKR